MSGADSIDGALVPDCLIAQGVRLVAKAQDVLCDVDDLVTGWRQLEGAVALLSPAEADMTVDEADATAEAWHDLAGVLPLMRLLSQMCAVIEHRTGICGGELRPLAETNNAADAWRHARGDGR